MDAGTGFSAQLYDLSPYFLHKVRVDVCFYTCKIHAC